MIGKTIQTTKCIITELRYKMFVNACIFLGLFTPMKGRGEEESIMHSLPFISPKIRLQSDSLDFESNYVHPKQCKCGDLTKKLKWKAFFASIRLGNDRQD